MKRQEQLSTSNGILATTVSVTHGGAPITASIRENPDPILTPVEAAAWVGCRPQTLAYARCTRTGAYASLPWVKLGHRIGYRRSDLQRWVEQQLRGAAVEA